MLVCAIRKPWTTSALVARNVTGVSAGTSTHAGVNEYCWPMARTVTEPSGSTALPRLDSTNSPPRWSVLGSAVSTRGCRIGEWWRPANAAMPASSTMMPTEIVAQRRSTRAAKASAPGSWPWCSIIGRHTLSREGSARHEHEQVEGEPDRDDNHGRDSGQGECAAGT